MQSDLLTSILGRPGAPASGLPGGAVARSQVLTAKARGPRGWQQGRER